MPEKAQILFPDAHEAGWLLPKHKNAGWSGKGLQQKGKKLQAHTAKPAAKLNRADACVDDDDTPKNFQSKCTFHHYHTHLHSAPFGF